MLSQEVAKGFVRQCLKIHTSIAGEERERLPDLLVEPDSFTGHISPRQ